MTETTRSPALRSPEQYRESLRDSRTVFYRGEKVEDVTTHPVLRHAVEHDDPRLSDGRGPGSPRAGGDRGRIQPLLQGPGQQWRSAGSQRVNRGRDAGGKDAGGVDQGDRHRRTVLAAGDGRHPRRALRRPDPRLLRALPRQRSGGLRRPDRCQGRSQPRPVAAAQPGRLPAGRRAPPRRDRRSRRQDPHLRIGQRERADRPADPGDGPRGSRLRRSIRDPARHARTHARRKPLPVDQGQARAEYPLSAERKMVETTTLFDDVFVPAERVFMAGETSTRESSRAGSSSSIASPRSPTSCHWSTRSSAAPCSRPGSTVWSAPVTSVTSSPADLATPRHCGR